MDIAQFLARVVPPGNFMTVSVNYDPTKPGMFGNRMFPHGAFAEAAGYIRWASNKGLDAYFALASYRMAEPKTDARGNVNTIRQNLQLEYVTQLAAMLRGPGAATYDHVSKSAAVASLKKIQAQVATPVGDAESRAHRQHVALVVGQALDPKS